jgi:hypothetical protein
MSRKKQPLTKAGEPRKRAPGAGRPSLGKVKLTVHILPATRKALGDKPGEVLDAHFGGSNIQAVATASTAPRSHDR